MDIKIVNNVGGSLSFILKDADVSVANAFRRVMLTEVPILAIDEVEFYDNTSSLYDEVLAHRVGLVPVVTDLSVLNFRENCKCKDGCPSCQVELSLKKSGPATVYSHDIKSTSKNLTTVPGIPLVKLGKNQSIDLKAIAVLGTSHKHAKWQPAVVGYKYYPLIEISDKCNQCGACVDACPKNILVIKKDKLKVTDVKKCILCRACTEACDAGEISIKGDENRFIYEIETTGSLKPTEIFTNACDILIEKAEELASKL
jgi:DNA-directed RNA polymerase subunit D